MLSAPKSYGVVVPRVPAVKAVCIGASAGGIEALTAVLPSVPADTPIPVFVVIHLPPGRSSRLVELFASRCQARVREPLDKEPIGPGIWFAAPDYHLLVESDFTFGFSVDEPVHFSRPAIDMLFTSAADVYGEGLVGIVLTGASQDGADGARAIRDAGGFVIVQDPMTALASTMPAAAVGRATPQIVTTLPEIALLLRDVARARES